VKAAQNEASPAALCRKTEEAQNPMSVERDDVLRWYLPEARDAGSAYSCDGRAEAAEAVEELTDQYASLRVTLTFGAANGGGITIVQTYVSAAAKTLPTAPTHER